MNFTVGGKLCHVGYSRHARKKLTMCAVATVSGIFRRWSRLHLVRYRKLAPRPRRCLATGKNSKIGTTRQTLCLLELSTIFICNVYDGIRIKQFVFFLNLDLDFQLRYRQPFDSYTKTSKFCRLASSC